ncbi:uncharacterized protein LOC120922021 [Rana temporaria]|uniref:uncharacterized protein LOC120922021 n=1 Tax=Rana temporaria TaxID=8407 RepID=UPI001AAD8607|nr:uncharacterized protein LOC120922021 [Rana temporaria]
MMIISVSSGTVYIQSGSDITDCNMKCPEDEDTVELFRECGGDDRTLLENLCFINATKSHDSRLRLHTGSGCWKLTHARKDDSCVYKVWCHCATGYLMSTTEIRVLDPVLISNITSTGGRLGEETVVSVQFSGEESAVTWEVDGEPLPERYRLIDDNRTLIIPGVQRDDAERRFRVRITNPVSEEIREYRLEVRDLPSDYTRSRIFLIVAGLLGVIIGIIPASLIYCRRRGLKSNGVYKDESLAEVRSVPPINNGPIPINDVPQDEPLVEVRSVPPIQNGSIPTNDVPQDVPLAEVRAVPSIQNGSIPINDVPQEVLLVENRSVPPIQNGFTLAIGVPKVLPLAEVRSVPPIQNGYLPTNKTGSPPATNVHQLRENGAPLLHVEQLPIYIVT